MDGSHGFNAELISGLMFILKLSALSADPIETFDWLNERIEIDGCINVVSSKPLQYLRGIAVDFPDNIFKHDIRNNITDLLLGFSSGYG